jgi:hypothetical protein
MASIVSHLGDKNKVLEVMKPIVETALKMKSQMEALHLVEHAAGDLLRELMVSRVEAYTGTDKVVMIDGEPYISEKDLTHEINAAFILIYQVIVELGGIRYVSEMTEKRLH